MFRFPQFPRLPKEIQRIIWTFAKPDPRAIYVEGGHDVRIVSGGQDRNGNPLPDREEYILKECQTQVPVPAILHACWESRAAGLKMYSSVFQNQ